MPKLHFSTELSQHTPAERRALVECKKWLKLKSNGRLTELKAKQKEVFLAGLFIQIAAPDLAYKLAANLDDVDDNALLDYIERWKDKLDLNPAKGSVVSERSIIPEGSIDPSRSEKLEDPIKTSAKTKAVDKEVVESTDLEKQKSSKKEAEKIPIETPSVDQQIESLKSVRGKGIF